MAKSKPPLQLDIALSQRFWSKVDKSAECWPWTGSRKAGGYGDLGIGSRKDGSRRTERAHRVAWALTHGPVPEGMEVCHSCDNPPCCNPAHLFLGTHADNMRDMFAKGRRPPPRGERNGRARLTEQDVEAIRERWAAGGVTQKAIGDAFGVTSQHVSDIVFGRKRRAS